MIGHSISQYKILEKVGEGGMGQVFKAWDTRLQRLVALKVLPADKVDDPERRERLLREARAASALNHPAIITIHNVLEEDGLDCIVMEYLEGTSLDRRIPAEGLPVDQAARYALRIAEAVGRAHGAGIVHRDLKPANIMVLEGDRIKVLDFGLAKNEGSATPEAPTLTQAAPITQAGAILGTVQYMSPEQALGQPVDGRSDIFSLGAILYEMLSGQRPFQGANPVSLLHSLAFDAPRPLSGLRPDVPASLGAVVTKALAKGPEERFQTMEEMARALAEAAGIEAELSGTRTQAAGASGLKPPTQAPASASPSSLMRARQLARRRPLAVFGAGALLMAAVALAALPRARESLTTWLGGSRAESTASAPAPEELDALEPYELYQLGAKLLERYDKEGFVDQAIDRFQRAIAKKPDYAAAYSGLGEAMWRKYRLTRDAMWLDFASRNADQALEIDPHFLGGRTVSALVLAVKGGVDAAEAEFDEVLALDPTNSRAHRGLGDVALTRGDPQEAELAYSRALESGPDNWEVHQLRGAVRYRLGDYEGAESDFRRSLELAPDSFSGFTSLAAALHMQDDYAGAAATLQRALEVKPDAHIYSNLGNLYYFQGLYQQAVSAFEKAVELGANNYQFWGNLADAYRRTAGKEVAMQEAYLRAAQLASERLEATPDDAYLRAQLALYLARRGDVEPAMAEVERLAIGPDSDPSVVHLVAQAFEATGNRGRALGAVEQALRGGYSLEEFRKDPEFDDLRADPLTHRLMMRLEQNREQLESSG